MPSADLVRHLAQFARALRAAHVTVALADEIDAAQALSLVDVADRPEVRNALLIALKIHARDRTRFDAMFESWWRLAPPVTPAPRQRKPVGPPGGMPIRTPNVRRVATRAPEREMETPEGGEPSYSAVPMLKRKDFGRWTDAELERMDELVARMAVRLSTRRSRRLVPTRGRGRIDLRRSLRGSVATSGELLSLARRHRPIERPRLLLLCDTSGSMDPYARFLLAFVLSLGRVVRTAEVFAFNTTLTRITRWLVRGRIGATLDRLAAEVPDWSGGTRIGDCLSIFVRDYLRTLVTPRTVVVMLSDGLDRGDPDIVRSAMRSIHHAARRVIWLNPLMGDPRYEPSARGMHAALPFIDQLAPAHNLESLERMIPFLTV